MPTTETFEPPPELARWGRAMQGMKTGPRKHPGSWWEVLFHRWRGLAAGDEFLEPDDPALRAKVRRPTLEDALAEAVREMHRISATLTPADDYDERFAQYSKVYNPVLWTVTSPD